MQPLKNLVLLGNKDSLSLLYTCSHFMQTFFFIKLRKSQVKKHFHIYSESWKEIVVTVGGETYMEFYSPLVPYVFSFVFYNILKKRSDFSLQSNIYNRSMIILRLNFRSKPNLPPVSTQIEVKTYGRFILKPMKPLSFTFGKMYQRSENIQTPSQGHPLLTLWKPYMITIKYPRSGYILA